jgi:hypothetical protein
MSAGALACFLLAAAGHLPGGPPRAPSPEPDGLAAVRAVLQRTEGATPASDDVLVRRLVALGSTSAPALFALVTGEALDALLIEESADAWMCPPDRVGALALAALAELPQVPLEACLRASAAARPSREVRTAGLLVLGRAGAADGLDLWFELVAALGPELELHSVRATAQEALLAILAEDRGAVRALEKPLAAAPLAHKRLVCETLARSRRGDAATVLVRCTGLDPELDKVALASLAELAARYPWRMPEGIALRLRACLERPDPALRALAARSLGMLKDSASCAALVAKLADPKPEVARSALWALRETCAQPRLTTRDEWQAWFEAERAWWSGPGLAQLEILQTGAPADVAGALRALLPHALGRDQVAVALAARLPELEPAARAAACGTLVQLGSRKVVPALVELLFESDDAVRHAAWTALRTLTGEELPAEPRLWETYASG